MLPSKLERIIYGTIGLLFWSALGLGGIKACEYYRRPQTLRDVIVTNVREERYSLLEDWGVVNISCLEIKVDNYRGCLSFSGNVPNVKEGDQFEYITWRYNLLGCNDILDAKLKMKE